MKCEICGREFLEYRYLGIHIKKFHKIETKEYYDTHLKQLNEDICHVCGNSTKFISLSSGYARTCSISCGQKHQETRTKTNKTCLEKYGSKSYFGSKENIEQTHSKEALDKRRNTMLQKYGYVSSFSNQIVRDKCKQTLLDKYGADNAMRISSIRQKVEQTNRQKYHAKYPFGSLEIQEKIKQTNLNRYGVKNPFQSKVLMKNKGNSIEARRKAKLTRSKNMTNSKLEDFLESQFILHGISYIAEHKDRLRYPYFCDFYLPETDTFVEINGFITHNDHFYDEINPEDRKYKKLLKEKAKTSEFAKSILRVWTQTDVEKRLRAKKNNLNYVVLWNKDDIEDWINSNFIIRHDFEV